MFFADLLAALIVSFIAVAILIALMGWEQPRGAGVRDTVLFMFTIFFLVVWAAGVWARPLGPPLWGVYWLPFLFAGVIVFLIMLAVVPPRRPRTRREAVEQAREETEAVSLFGCFFWVLLVILLFSIVSRYVWVTPI